MNRKNIGSFTKKILRSLLVAVALVSCGGDSSSSNVPSGDYVSGLVTLYLNRDQSIARLEYSALVYVKNAGSSGMPIDNATVTVNEQAIPYNLNYKSYRGVVVPNAAGTFNLSVSVNGVTYTATEAAWTTIPELTVPMPFYAAANNTISWTAPVGAPANINYKFELIDFSVTPWLRAFDTGILTAYVTVPASKAVVGKTYIATVYASYAGGVVANAAVGSRFTSSASGQTSTSGFTAQ